jgi:hypothetical protein
MRLTILAGMITGASLAMQVAVNAHARPKPIPPNSAIQIRVIAPWYMAMAGEPILNRSQVTTRAGEAAAMT